jgi:hypothetical protein
MRILERAHEKGETPHVHVHAWEMRAARVAPGLRAILERFQGVAIDDLRARFGERGAA